MYTVFLLVVLLVVLAGLISQDVPKNVSFAIVAVFLLYFTLSTPTIISSILWGIFVLFSLMVFATEIRKAYLTKKIFRYVKKILPPVSETEKVALEAGDVWLESDLFQGRPDWEKVSKLELPGLSQEEKDFLTNEVEQLCAELNDWDIYKNGELPKSIWSFLKDNNFFGLIIPKEYGGRAFSAQAHSMIVGKIASKSIACAITVMVPNSLGPAELLMHYGSKEQKDEYLPKLAVGKDLPCFALTSPTAGSDAGSLTDSGVVIEKTVKGQKKLFIRLSWNKRYITLAPVATLIGVAFQLFDPDKLLGDKESLGITLALIPSSTKGVKKSKRHSPVGLGFMNGTTEGENVEVPIEAVIGEEEGIGQGWRMLMECLSIGRAISLPALASAACKVAYRSSGAYARIRHQFRLPIGKFEGVQEALARIGGLTYLTEATRKMTAASVDLNIKPALISAITKYHLTEIGRRCINDAMDIHAGRAVQFGPANYLGLMYLSIPMSITVEGANILTRSLMIFGQGAVRCHPLLQKEMETFSEPDEEKAIDEFDEYLIAHIKQVYKNGIDAFFHGLLKGRLFDPKLPTYIKNKARILTVLSKNLSYCADVSFALLGGELKRKECLSARLGDVLSHLYMATAVIHYYLSEEETNESKEHAAWALEYCLYQIKVAFLDFFDNFPYKLVAKKMKLVALPSLRGITAPCDELSKKIASSMQIPSEFRNRLTGSLFVYSEEGTALNSIETAFEKTIEISLIEKKIIEAIRNKTLKKGMMGDEKIDALKELKILDQSELNQYIEASKAVDLALAVDEF